MKELRYLMYGKYYFKKSKGLCEYCYFSRLTCVDNTYISLCKTKRFPGLYETCRAVNLNAADNKFFIPTLKFRENRRNP